MVVAIAVSGGRNRLGPCPQVTPSLAVRLCHSRAFAQCTSESRVDPADLMAAHLHFLGKGAGNSEGREGNGERILVKRSLGSLGGSAKEHAQGGEARHKPVRTV